MTDDLVIKTHPIIPAPPPFGIMMLKDETARWEDLEVTDYPYYIGTDKGWFCAQPSLYGWGVLPISARMPGGLVTPTDQKNGYFLQNDIKIPQWIVWQALDWFQKVFERLQSEAAIILTYNRTLRKWRTFIPEQTVTHGGVNYKVDATKLQRGWVPVGSIHSHCDFSAFHSGTDTHDANGASGIHMTIGYVNRAQDKGGPETAQMLSFDKSRITLDYEEAVDVTAVEGVYTAPEWWFLHISKPVHTPYRAPAYGSNNGYQHNYSRSYVETKHEPNFISPKDSHVIYDAYKHNERLGGGISQKYCVPDYVTDENGISHKTPYGTPGQEWPSWIEYYAAMGLDATKWLMNAANFPDFYKLHPDAIQYLSPTQEKALAIIRNQNTAIVDLSKYAQTNTTQPVQLELGDDMTIQDMETMSEMWDRLTIEEIFEAEIMEEEEETPEQMYSRASSPEMQAILQESLIESVVEDMDKMSQELQGFGLAITYKIKKIKTQQGAAHV